MIIHSSLPSESLRYHRRHPYPGEADSSLFTLNFQKWCKGTKNYPHTQEIHMLLRPIVPPDL